MLEIIQRQMKSMTRAILVGIPLGVSVLGAGTMGCSPTAAPTRESVDLSPGTTVTATPGPESGGGSVGIYVTQEKTVSGGVASGETGLLVTPDEGKLLSKVTVDLGGDFQAVNVCSTKMIFGLSGEAVCQSGTASNAAAVGDVLQGKEYWDGTGVKRTGTLATVASHMSTNYTSNSSTVTLTPNAGVWNGTNTVSITDASLTSGNICSSHSVFGVSGGATCQGAAGSGTIAAEGNICTGYYAYDDNGVARTGSASCGVSTIDLIMTSQIHHDTGIASGNIKKMSQEDGIAATDANYRMMPKISKDDDAGAGSSVSRVVRWAGGVQYQYWDGTVPRKVCGKDATSITAKIQDCYDQHAIKPSWDAGVVNRISWNGEVNGNAGQGSWTLVTVYSSSLANGTACDVTCYEVWRDDRTNFLWSDKLGSTNWCKATGSSNSAYASLPASFKEDDPNNYCDSQTYQEQTNAPESWCLEHAALNTPATYDPMKGGMRLATTPAATWRLPTIYDWEQANINGVRFVLPNMGGNFWSASIYSASRAYAWNIHGSYGNVSSDASRITSYGVHCLAR